VTTDQLKSKEDFPTVIWIFVDDWQQNTNLFILRKKTVFPTIIWTPIRDPKGIQKEDIQEDF
jgi:hypothetical protein